MICMVRTKCMKHQCFYSRCTYITTFVIQIRYIRFIKHELSVKQAKATSNLHSVSYKILSSCIRIVPDLTLK